MRASLLVGLTATAADIVWSAFNLFSGFVRLWQPYGSISETAWRLVHWPMSQLIQLAAAPLPLIVEDTSIASGWKVFGLVAAYASCWLQAFLVSAAVGWCVIAVIRRIQRAEHAI